MKKPEKIHITPTQLIIRLRNPNCDCCPFGEECYDSETTTCLLFEKAAECIETLLKKGN